MKNNEEDKKRIAKEIGKLFDGNTVEFTAEVMAISLAAVCYGTSHKTTTDFEFVQETVKELFNEYFDHFVEVIKNERKH